MSDLFFAPIEGGFFSLDLNVHRQTNLLFSIISKTTNYLVPKIFSAISS